eukprot:m.92282 g.92282  ORF g.92282 m.92282 type:complete len:81 (+) comp16519_c0_seq1:1144-1386(+)
MQEYLDGITYPSVQYSSDIVSAGIGNLSSDIGLGNVAHVADDMAAEIHSQLVANASYPPMPWLCERSSVRSTSLGTMTTQ